MFDQITLFLFIAVVCYVRIYVAILMRTSRHVAASALRGSRDYTNARAAAKTTALILAALIICWLPFSVLTSVLTIDTFLSDGRYFIAYELSIYLLYTNSFLNPVILYWNCRDYRKAYR